MLRYIRILAFDPLKFLNCSIYSKSQIYEYIARVFIMSYYIFKLKKIDDDKCVHKYIRDSRSYLHRLSTKLLKQLVDF